MPLATSDKESGLNQPCPGCEPRTSGGSPRPALLWTSEAACTLELAKIRPTTQNPHPKGNRAGALVPHSSPEGKATGRPPL